MPAPEQEEVTLLPRNPPVADGLEKIVSCFGELHTPGVGGLAQARLAQSCTLALWVILRLQQLAGQTHNRSFCLFCRLGCPPTCAGKLKILKQRRALTAFNSLALCWCSTDG